MKGYILRWNPTISSWNYDRQQNLMDELKADGDVEMNWSIYDFEDLEEGDFFILQQVGTESDGIAMVGTFSSEPYTSASWKKKDRTNLFYADMKIDFMMNRRNMTTKPGKPNKWCLNADELSEKFPSIDWHGGHSGVLIPEEVLEPLVLEICHQYFMTRATSENDAFIDRDTLWQTACDYINVFCPNMRQTIITECADSMVYENFGKGDTIDMDLLDITYDEKKKGIGDAGPKFFTKFLVPRA